jgi:hypothetical protein
MWSQLQVGATRLRPLILVGEGWNLVMQVLFEQLGDYVPDKYRRLVVNVPDVERAFMRLQTMNKIADGS